MPSTKSHLKIGLNDVNSNLNVMVVGLLLVPSPLVRWGDPRVIGSRDPCFGPKFCLYVDSICGLRW